MSKKEGEAWWFSVKNYECWAGDLDVCGSVGLLVCGCGCGCGVCVCVCLCVCVGGILDMKFVHWLFIGLTMLLRPFLVPIERVQCVGTCFVLMTLFQAQL